MFRRASAKELIVTLSQHYRFKATESAQLAGQSSSSGEQRILARAARSYTVLADNEEWLASNADKVVPADPALKDQANEPSNHIGAE
jgi:hypothetical protein